jgi:hypothetical protein
LFDDIFHELNDDLEKEAIDWHLNHYYINFEDKIQDEPLNASSKSQSQIGSTLGKKINTSDDGLFFHTIPDYLSASNLSFRATFLSELRSYFNPIDFQDLQQLAMLTHQMSILHLHQEFWQRLLQSGTGQLQQRVQPSTSSSSQYNNIDKTLSFWPEIVTSVMISQGIINVNHRQDEIDQDIYVNFVRNYLDQLEKKVNQCRLQFNTIKNSLPNYSDILDDKIDHFIQKEGLIGMQLHFQTRIAFIKYICHDRSYQLEYFQQKPTNLQVRFYFVVASHDFLFPINYSLK